MKGAASGIGPGEIWPIVAAAIFRKQIERAAGTTCFSEESRRKWTQPCSSPLTKTEKAMSPATAIAAALGHVCLAPRRTRRGRGSRHRGRLAPAKAVVIVSIGEGAPVKRSRVQAGAFSIFIKGQRAVRFALDCEDCDHLSFSAKRKTANRVGALFRGELFRLSHKHIRPLWGGGREFRGPDRGTLPSRFRCPEPIASDA